MAIYKEPVKTSVICERQDIKEFDEVAKQKKLNRTQLFNIVLKNYLAQQSNQAANVSN